MQGKKTFLLYCDMIHIFEELTDEQAGILIKHIMKYVNDQNPVLNDQLLKIAFAPIKNALKKDLDEWIRICERNSNNGKKGGRPKNPIEPKKPNGFNSNPKNPSKADKDMDKDMDMDISNNENKEEINDSVFKSISNNTRWIEAFCIKFRTDPEIVIEHLKKFYIHCIIIDKWKKTDSEAMAHFNNWVNKGNPIPERKKNSLVDNPGETFY